MSALEVSVPWQGLLKDNPRCEISGLNLYEAIEITHVLFSRFGAGLDMDILLDCTPEERVMVLVTEILNICSINEQANNIVKNADLIGFFHRYATQQL